jgi:hypothetical protein
VQTRARTVLSLAVVLVVIGVPLGVLFAGGGGDPEPKAKPGPGASAGVRIERGVQGDVTLYVEPSVNVRSRAGGRTEVQVRCLDEDGGVVMAQDEGWPFAQTDGGLFDPHAHLALDPIAASAVVRCQIAGTRPLLEARVP